MSRLDELRKQQSSTPTQSTGTRLDKLRSQKTAQSLERPVRPTRIMETPSMDITKSPLMKTIQVQPVTPPAAMDVETRARQLPVIGPALKTLDVIAKKTDPIADIMRSFYTPGAGLGAIGGATNVAKGAVGALAERFAPKLGSTLGGRMVQKGLSEAIVGAPLGAAQTQILSPDASVGELGKGAALGAGLGGLVGAATPAVGRGIQGLRDFAKRQADEIARGAIRNVPTGRAVSSPFAEGADILNPIARGYTEQVARTFEPPTSTGSALDRLRASRVPTAEPIPVSPTGTPQAAAEIPTAKPISTGIPTQAAEVPTPRVQQAVTPNEQLAFDYIRANPSAGTNEIQGLFKLGYGDIQKLKDAALNDIPYKGLGGKPTPTVGAEVPATIQRAEIPAQPTAREQGIHSNYQYQMERGDYSSELKNMMQNADNTYEIAKNAESLRTAYETVNANLPKAEVDFLANEAGGAAHIAIGNRLIKELDAVGEHTRALAVYDKLLNDLTKSGQTSQAARLISSADGRVLELVRTAERTGKKVSEKDYVEFKKIAGVHEEKAGAGIHANKFNEILDKIESGKEVSPEELKQLDNFLSRAQKAIKPKEEVLPISEELPIELKQPKKREKVISFFDDAEQAALARIAARKNNLNSLPLPEWRDHTIVVASQLAKGAIKAATHVEDLVRLFGEEIRPVATQVFQSAQSMLKGVSKSAASDNLEKAQQALRALSGEAQQEKEAVKIMGDHVKKLIADAKAGSIDPNDVQKLRDYSDEIAEMISKKPPRKLPSEDDKFLQSVKSLAKKIAEVDEGTVTPDQATKEISNLIRQVTKITGDEIPRIKPDPKVSQALSDIAHDVMQKTRPTPKPTTLQEKIVEKYIKKNPQVSEEDMSTLRQLAKDTTRLSSDQKIDAEIAMQKILNSYEKSSLWDKTLAIRYMSMLLNTHTQLVNAISGPIMATTGYGADVLGTMLDIGMNKVLKTPRTTTLYGSNPISFIAGWLKNAKIGGKAGAQGVNPAGIQSTNEIRGLAFKSLKNPLGLAERGLGAIAKGADYATYKRVFDAEMAKQGYIDAINAGVKGKENIQNHIAKFINDPSEKAILQADNIGKETTFQRSDTLGGKAANWLNVAPGPVKPFVNAIFPFVRTPVNIAESAITMTPAGVIKGLYQLTSKSPATQREALRSLSLGLTGSAGLGALGYYLNKIGVITADNDSGDKDADIIREQVGKGKYRFNTSALLRYLDAMMNGEGSEAAEKAAIYQDGDSAFDYNKLQPLAFPAAIGASLSRNKELPIGERLGKAGESAFGSLFGMSTLKGVQDVFQPQYGGTVGEKALGTPMRIAESFFKSFSPSALAQEARRQDPTQRKVAYNEGFLRDVTDYFKSRTPGLSQALPPSKTTLGITKQYAPGITGQYLNPYRSEVAPYSDAAKVISDLIDRTGDLTLAPSAPEKKVTGKDKLGKPVSIAIPQERYAKLQEEIGNEIIKNVLAISPTLTDAKKAEKLKTIYSDAKEKYRTKVKKELGVR